LIYNLASAATVTVASSYQFHYRYQAIYSRLNYSYNEKYFLNLPQEETVQAALEKKRDLETLAQ